MNKKRIIHIIDSICVGGAEKLLCNTIPELPEYEHVVLTLFPSADLSLLPPGVRHIDLGAKTIKDLPGKAIRYRNLIKSVQPALVHAHLYFATIFSKSLTPSGIPLVFTQHFEFSKNATKWYYRSTDRMVSSKKHHCIAVSNSVLQDYLKSTSFKGKTHIVGNYIPDQFFQYVPRPVTKNRLRLVSVGNIKPIKNQEYILDAFAHMKDLDVSCDIYGDGVQLEQLRERAMKGQLQVNFKGLIADSGAILKDYDVYIMPSLTEGFPLALFEAMAGGLPVVVSDIPVFHEVLGNEGRYIPLNRPEHLRNIILDYLENASLLKEEGARMHQIAKEKASKSRYLKKLRDVYAQLLKV